MADAVQPSDLIYVVAGLPERKQYGLELFHAGFAPRLLLSVGRFEVSGMTRFPIAGIEQLLEVRDSTAPRDRHFFVELSAGGACIRNARVLHCSTYGEIEAFRRFTEHEKLRRIIVVSTDVHLRRVAFSVRRIFGPAGIEFLYCPVPARLQPLNQKRWWTRCEDRRFVLSELVKLAGYQVLRRSSRSAAVAELASRIARKFL